MVKKMVRVIDEGLDAKVTRRIKLSDDQVVEYHDVDHRTRLAFAKQADDFAQRVSMVPGKSSGDNSGASTFRVRVILEGGRAAVEIGRHG
jgi:hypothetical protein